VCALHCDSHLKADSGVASALPGLTCLAVLLWCCRSSSLFSKMRDWQCRQQFSMHFSMRHWPVALQREVSTHARNRPRRPHALSLDCTGGQQLCALRCCTVACTFSRREYYVTCAGNHCGQQQHHSTSMSLLAAKAGSLRKCVNRRVAHVLRHGMALYDVTVGSSDGCCSCC